MNTAVLMRRAHRGGRRAGARRRCGRGPICSTRPRRGGSAAAPTRSCWRRRRTTSPACSPGATTTTFPSPPAAAGGAATRAGRFRERRRRRRARGPADGGGSIEPLQWRGRDRERRDDTRGAATGARARALLPPRPRRGRAVPTRRQRRNERRRPPRLQVRRHRRLGDEHRSRAIAPGAARHVRQRRAQGRRRLDVRLAADRLGRHARDRDGGRG